ncbi:MAG: hypothetical protein Q9227_009186 [Pyrenula ochraceoflavens]
MARIIELFLDTDDKRDPSYGVVIFLILSAATEVTAIICACLPVIGPYFFKRLATTQKHSSDSKQRGFRSTPVSPYSHKSRGFEILDGSVHGTEDLSTTNFSQDDHLGKHDVLPMNNNITAITEGSRHSSRQENDRIWVESEVEVTIAKP